MKNHIHLEGIVAYVSKTSGFILKVDDDFIHCRGVIPKIDEEMTIEGRLRSYEKHIRGQKVTLFVVDVI